MFVWESVGVAVRRRAREAGRRRRVETPTRAGGWLRRRCCSSRWFRCSPTGNGRRAPARRTRADFAVDHAQLGGAVRRARRGRRQRHLPALVRAGRAAHPPGRGGGQHVAARTPTGTCASSSAGPIYPYDAAKGPAIYRDKQWPKPTTPPLHMTHGSGRRGARVLPDPEASDVRRSGPSRRRSIRKRLPQDAAGTGYLDRADVFVLRMIDDSFKAAAHLHQPHGRAMRRDAGAGEQRAHAGAGAEGVRSHRGHGRDTVMRAGRRYMDVDTYADALGQRVPAPKSLAKRNGWVDMPSINIPYLYIATAVELEQIEQSLGRPAGAARAIATPRGSRQRDFDHAFPIGSCCRRRRQPATRRSSIPAGPGPGPDRRPAGTTRGDRGPRSGGGPAARFRYPDCSRTARSPR